MKHSAKPNFRTDVSQPDFEGPVDVGIIVALREEFRELHPQLPTPQAIKDEKTGASDYLFQWDVENGTAYRCAATFVGVMGPTEATLATERFLNRRQPKTIVMLGIAAGINDDVKLGDVIVATHVGRYLDRAKVISNKDKTFEIRPGGDAFPCSGDLVRASLDFEFAHQVRYESWQQSCQTELTELVTDENQSQLLDKDWLNEQPGFFDGPVASGPVVAVAEEFVDWVISTNRNYLALEMEGGGMLAAVYSRADPGRSMMLRGISDFGDKRKKTLDRIGKGGLRHYATRNAIRLLWGLMEADILPRRGDPERSQTKVPDAASQNASARGESSTGETPAVVSPDDSAPTPVVSIAHLPTPAQHFVGRDDELARLDTAWDDPATTVISLVAFGGVGKSALVAEWLKRLRTENWRDASHVFGHSFYSQGSREDAQASADSFIDEALRFFGDENPETGSPWEKGERLARLTRGTKTLLVLDGMEPLQYGPAAGDAGQIKDPALQALVRELAADNPGLCVITTRQAVSDIPAALSIDLEHLSPEAGAALLKALGVKGTQDELEDASREVWGHGLALTLLGNYLRKACGGDVRRIGEVELSQADRRQGGHARKLMEKYERWLGEGPELSILRLLGLFDRPAEADSLAALREAPAIAGLTDSLVDLSEQDWNYAVSNLAECGLVATSDYDALLDSHPLVREHFAEQLAAQRPDATREAHRRLYEHLKHLKGVASELPDNLQDMMPLYHAVAHGCKAVLWQNVLKDVYIPRIRRVNERFSVRKLGAFGVDLVAITGFFEPPWRRLESAIPKHHQGWLLNDVGFRLRALGRLAESA